ncbi:MAG: DNA polymerase III subunit gamma/tau [Gemmatimonadota bacterium]
MTHQPLALKYRPARFADVISQEHVTRTLQNALEQNRVAQAYLFAGPRGSGKTTTARLLAKALNCERGVSGEPCGECENCRAIAAGRSLDVIEIDAASNRGIDDIKELRETVKYAPAQGRYKVYIVDEVHQLSKDAFNAFLKTLEEPPKSVVFVLATTEPHKILATILSRCQRFDFRPIPLAAIRGRVRSIAEREGIRLDDAAEFAIAKKADGSLRDALSLLDQVVAFGGETIDVDALRRLIGVPDEERYLELTKALLAGDARAALGSARELRATGYDLESFYEGFLEHLRNLLLFAIGEGDALAEVPARYLEAYRETASALGQEDLLRMLTLATDEEQVFRRSSQQALVLEVLLVRLALLDRTVDLDRLLAALGSGGRTASGSAADRKASSRGTVSRTGASEASPAASGTPGGGTAGAARGSEAGSPQGSLSIERLRAAWDEVVEAVHAERPTVAALLQGARPAACSVESVTLEVPRGAEFRLEQLRRRGTLEPLVRALGARWSFAGRIEVLETGEDVPPLERDPVLQQVADLFDASVVRVQRSSPASS